MDLLQRMSGTYISVINNRNQDPVEQYKSKPDMTFGPPWHYQRAPNIRDVAPIKR